MHLPARGPSAPQPLRQPGNGGSAAGASACVRPAAVGCMRRHSRAARSWRQRQLAASALPCNQARTCTCNPAHSQLYCPLEPYCQRRVLTAHSDSWAVSLAGCQGWRAGGPSRTGTTCRHAVGSQLTPQGGTPFLWGAGGGAHPPPWGRWSGVGVACSGGDGSGPWRRNHWHNCCPRAPNPRRRGRRRPFWGAGAGVGDHPVAMRRRSCASSNPLAARAAPRRHSSLPYTTQRTPGAAHARQIPAPAPVNLPHTPSPAPSPHGCA